MSNNLYTSQKYLTSKLLLSCTLILSLILTISTAVAEYKPPAKPSSPKTPTGSNSSRTNECTGNNKTTLTALAPFSHVGQTVSLQPTFAWFVPNSPTRKIKFTLYEYTNGKAKPFYQKNLQSSSEIMQLSLADEQTSLLVGKQYLWQVALLCNPNHPSQNLITRTEIEVVAIPSNLKNELSRTQEILRRSSLYAEQGFWYDALAETLKNSQNKASTFKLLAELSQLEKAEIRRITDPNRKKELEQQALRLEKIIAAEQALIKVGD